MKTTAAQKRERRKRQTKKRHGSMRDVPTGFHSKLSRREVARVRGGR